MGLAMPLAAPIDYSLNVQQPAAAGQQGFAFGQAARETAFNDQQKDFAFRQQQIAAQRQAQQRADLNALAYNPAPTARDYASVVLKYPELKDSFDKSFQSVNAEQKQQRIDAAAPIFAAMQSNRPDLAISLLEKNVQALTNSGAPDQEVKAAQTWLDMAKQAPDHAQDIGGIYLASIMGPEKFESAFSGIGKENRANAAAPGDRASTAATTAKTNAEAGVVVPKALADVANIGSQITERAGRLALDVDKLESETSLKIRELTQKGLPDQHPDVRKVIDTAAAASVMANNSATQMRGLADQFEKADPQSFGGAAIEGLKTFTGSQDYITQLRREYTRIRATQVNALLPPGPASDRDIINAQAGFLKDTADPQAIASWLRGMAKLQDYQAKYEDLRAEWVANVGHMGKTLKDIEVDGRKVPAGTTLTDFLRKTLAAPGPATQAPPPAAKTGYMQKYGTPGR